MTLPPGRFPILRPADLIFTTRPTVLRMRGPLRFGNTKHGPRLMIAVDVHAAIEDIDRRPPLVPPRSREFFIAFDSPCYVRLCEQFGDDLSLWPKGVTREGVIFVVPVYDARYRKTRISVLTPFMAAQLVIYGRTDYAQKPN